MRTYTHAKKILVITTIAIIFTIIALLLINQKYQTPIVTIPQLQHIPKTYTTSTESSILNPKSLNSKVPFTVQAPTANWDLLHNEACEEASAIMANAYFNSFTELKPNYVEEEINKLTIWQDENFGYHLDTTAAETALMIEKVYKLKTKLIENFSAEDIKTALANNQLVLISENGRLLNNPFYKSPGPIHHMLLIKGYDENNNFITNDSGTKRGLNLFYDFKTIFFAAADWDHTSNTVDANKKTAIIVWQ